MHVFGFRNFHNVVKKFLSIWLVLKETLFVNSQDFNWIESLMLNFLKAFNWIFHTFEIEYWVDWTNLCWYHFQERNEISVSLECILYAPCNHLLGYLRLLYCQYYLKVEFHFCRRCSHFQKFGFDIDNIYKNLKIMHEYKNYIITKIEFIRYNMFMFMHTTPARCWRRGTRYIYNALIILI